MPLDLKFKRPPSGVRDGVNWLFFVREFVKMEKNRSLIREMISFVIRETKNNVCDFVKIEKFVRDFVNINKFVICGS